MGENELPAEPYIRCVRASVYMSASPPLMPSALLRDAAAAAVMTLLPNSAVSSAFTPWSSVARNIFRPGWAASSRLPASMNSEVGLWAVASPWSVRRMCMPMV